MYGYRWCRALFLGTKTLAIDYCQHLHIAHRQYTLWHIAQTILKFNIEESKSKLWRARDRTGRVLWQSLRHYGSLYVITAVFTSLRQSLRHYGSLYVITAVFTSLRQSLRQRRVRGACQTHVSGLCQRHVVCPFNSFNSFVLFAAKKDYFACDCGIKQTWRWCL